MSTLSAAPLDEAADPHADRLGERPAMTEGVTSAGPHLLAAMGSAGRPVPLAVHEQVHGPLPAPRRREEERFVIEVLELLSSAGLRGRGGAAFPTARKIEVMRQQRRRGVLVVNAMESEPATGKDWVLLTGSPHVVLDGAEVVARLIGATSVIVCTPQDRPELAAAVATAVGERRRAGRAEVPVATEVVPERYVAGQESSLVHWLSGGPAVPLFRSTPATPLSLRRRPVLVHNAESLAQVAVIVRRRPETDGVAAGSSFLATVTGAVAAPGVFEVPLGLALSSLLDRAGAQRPVEAVLLGGYGGSWLGAEHLGVALAPEALKALGAALGTGAVVALPAGTCGLAETARLARWMAGESAGQCGPCVFGLASVAEDLERLAFSRATVRDVDRLRRRLSLVEGRGACRHPDGVATMVASALWAFSDHVGAHLHHGPCGAVRRPPVVVLPAHRGPGGVRR